MPGVEQTLNALRFAFYASEWRMLPDSQLAIVAITF